MLRVCQRIWRGTQGPTKVWDGVWDGLQTGCHYPAGRYNGVGKTRDEKGDRERRRLSFIADL
jgi:hypothetical protein